MTEELNLSIEKSKIDYKSPHDGLILHGLLYVSQNPKAIVHIIHGMSEHKERYDEFCTLLCKLGYVVLIVDNRGHGESINDDIPLGYFANNDGWLANVKDLNAIAMMIKEQYRRLPYFIFGHSMGSLLGHSYLKRYEDMVSGAIFCGMPAYNKQAGVGRDLANAIAKLQGGKKVSKTLVGLTNSYNSTIKDPRTEFDWISYNEENVDKYIDDPLCGFPFTNLGIRDLVGGMIDVFNKKDWRVLKQNLPILFIVGKDDPCADVPTGFRYSLDNLAKVGYTNIEANIYENMRHEILNENGRKLVYRDILTWFEVQVKALEAVQ